MFNWLTVTGQHLPVTGRATVTGQSLPVTGWAKLGRYACQAPPRQSVHSRRIRNLDPNLLLKTYWSTVTGLFFLVEAQS